MNSSEIGQVKTMGFTAGFWTRNACATRNKAQIVESLRKIEKGVVIGQNGLFNSGEFTYDQIVAAENEHGTLHVLLAAAQHECQTIYVEKKGKKEDYSAEEGTFAAIGEYLKILEKMDREFYMARKEAGKRAQEAQQDQRIKQEFEREQKRKQEKLRKQLTSIRKDAKQIQEKSDRFHPVLSSTNKQIQTLIDKPIATLTKVEQFTQLQKNFNVLQQGIRQVRSSYPALKRRYKAFQESEAFASDLKQASMAFEAAQSSLHTTNAGLSTAEKLLKQAGTVIERENRDPIPLPPQRQA